GRSDIGRRSRLHQAQLTQEFLRRLTLLWRCLGVELLLIAIELHLWLLWWLGVVGGLRGGGEDDFFGATTEDLKGFAQPTFVEGEANDEGLPTLGHRHRNKDFDVIGP